MTYLLISQTTRKLTLCSSISCLPVKFDIWNRPVGRVTAIMKGLFIHSYSVVKNELFLQKYDNYFNIIKIVMFITESFTENVSKNRILPSIFDRNNFACWQAKGNHGLMDIVPHPTMRIYLLQIACEHDQRNAHFVCLVVRSKWELLVRVVIWQIGERKCYV